MSNELGYYVAGSGSVAVAVTTSTFSSIRFAGLHTATAGDAVTLLKFTGRGNFSNDAAVLVWILYRTDTSAIVATERLYIPYSGASVEHTKVVNIPLTAGVEYALAYTAEIAQLTASVADNAAVSERTNATDLNNGTILNFDGYTGGGTALVAGDITNTPPRSITNIDTDNNVQAGQTGAVITGVGFDLPISSVTLGGESVTVTGTPTTTSITVDIPLHINLEWGSTTNDLVVTDATGPLTLNNVTLSAPTGWTQVTFTSAPDAGTTESFYEYSQTDAEVGNFTAALNDILAFEDQTGLTIDSQTIPIVDPPATVTGAYKWWDDSLSTWTPVSSFTINDLGAFGESSQIILRDVLRDVLKPILRGVLND